MASLLDVFGDKGLVGSIMDVLKGTGVLKDPETELKALTALHEFQTKMVQADVAALSAVNQTMAAEANSEHWLQWSWRPLVGYTFCLTIINNYVLIPYFSNFGLHPIDIPGEIWNALLVVLGVAAGTRGWSQIVTAGKASQR